MKIGWKYNKTVSFGNTAISLHTPALTLVGGGGGGGGGPDQLKSQVPRSIQILEA